MWRQGELLGGYHNGPSKRGHAQTQRGTSLYRDITKEKCHQARSVKCYRNLEGDYAQTMVEGVPANGSFVLSLEGGGQEGESVPCHWRAA